MMIWSRVSISGDEKHWILDIICRWSQQDLLVIFNEECKVKRRIKDNSRVFGLSS